MTTQNAAPHASLPHAHAAGPWWASQKTKRAATAMAAVAVLLLGYWLLFRFPYVITEDARVAMPTLRLAPEPPASGRVVALGAEVGDRVKAGQVLVELDKRGPEAQLKRAQAQAVLAQANCRRMEQLALQRGVPARDLDAARAASETAAAELALAQLALERSTLKSPVDGFVVQRTAEVGNLLEAGQVAMVVVDDSNAYVSANIEETEAAHVRPGQAVRISVDEGGSLTGRVLEVTAATASTFALIQADNPSGNYTKLVQRIPLKVKLDPHPGHPLRAGQSVVAKIRVHG